MKRGWLFWVLIVLFVIMVIAGFAAALAAIWTDDDRWGLTALMVGGVGLVGAGATATFPGWDW